MPMHCLHVFRFNFCKQKILDSNKKKSKVFTNLSMQISGKKGEGLGTLSQHRAFVSFNALLSVWQFQGGKCCLEKFTKNSSQS